ncbi:phenylalanine and histidine ammonia-lyase domain protein, partial [Burkholderia multivorans CF2]
IGVARDALSWMRRDIENELNSANDNPLVDPDDGCVLHGGNFYGDHIAFAMDALKTACPPSRRARGRPRRMRVASRRAGGPLHGCPRSSNVSRLHCSVARYGAPTTPHDRFWRRARRWPAVPRTPQPPCPPRRRSFCCSRQPLQPVRRRTRRKPTSHASNRSPAPCQNLLSKPFRPQNGRIVTPFRTRQYS